MKTSNAQPAIAAKTRSWWGRLDAMLVLAAFLGLAVLPAKAQAPVGAANGGDPPSRAARLSDVAGQVWIYSDDTGEWLTVGRNRPITTGDRIATDNNARAEITLGSTTLRLDAATEIEVAQLDDARYVVRLAKGSIAARLRSPQLLAEFEIDTDEGAFLAQTVGRYRIDRLDRGSELTVYNGQASYEGRSTALPLYTGQHAQFWIDNAGAPQYAAAAPARDAFFAFNDERDRSEDRIAATRQPFVSPEMTGADDLARYGRWQQTADDGPVWIPTAVPVDWAPYSVGHWAFIRPWGWTWVDDAPWGFAPFHYGRWVYRSNTWCWAPGTYVARPVYAPALVAWIGGPRSGVSISVGGPPVGWVPLAPREVYVPSYRASPRYVREVNITHVTNVTNITTIINNRNGEADRRDFANRRVPNAVTFVSPEVMTRRQPVGPAAARFRNDPQWRSFVADARPGPALSTPPVAAPPAAPRSAVGAQPPRPPFEGRGPGGFAGRPEGSRPEFDRGPAGRPAVVGPVTSPAPVGPVTSPAAVGPVTSPPPVGAPTSPRPIGAPATAVGPATSPPPVGALQNGMPRNAAPAVRESTPPAAAVAPVPTRPTPQADAQPQRMRIPAPVRGMQAQEAGRVAPALRGREGEGGNGAPPPAAPQAVQAQPQPQPQAAPVQPATPRAAEPRPAEAARTGNGDPRMNRPEAPRAREEAPRPREERREERRDDKVGR